MYTVKHKFTNEEISTEGGKTFTHGFSFKCESLSNTRSYSVAEKLIIIFRYGVNFVFLICHLISFRCLSYPAIIL